MASANIAGLLRDTTTGALVVSAADGALVYQPVVERVTQCNALSAATRFLPAYSLTPVTSAGNAGPGVFYFNPADYALIGHSAKLRLRVTALVNAVAPVSDFTVGIYPLASPTGAAGVLAFTPGTVIAGSSALITAPGANSTAHVETADFDAATLMPAGYYIMGVITSAAGTASSSVVLAAMLELRNVAA